MNKKLFTILLVAIFLVASVGFISAADASDDGDATQTISVKIKWNGDSQSDRPSSITVNLIKDGNVVDSAKLSADNSWSAKFTVDGDGSYSVKQASDLSDYSISTSGSASSGFVITNTLKESALGVPESDDTLEVDTDENNTLIANDTTEGTDTNNDTNETDEGSTDTNSTDENDTEIDGTDAPITDSTQDVTKEPVKKVEKKVEKKVVKKPKNVTQNKLKNTGLPVIVLVIVAIAIAFVPFRRKK